MSDSCRMRAGWDHDRPGKTGPKASRPQSATEAEDGKDGETGERHDDAEHGKVKAGAEGLGHLADQMAFRVILLGRKEDGDGGEAGANDNRRGREQPVEPGQATPTHRQHQRGNGQRRRRERCRQDDRIHRPLPSILARSRREGRLPAFASFGRADALRDAGDVGDVGDEFVPVH